MKDDHTYTRSFDEAKDADTIISKVLLCGTPTTPDPQSVLHWHIYLILPRGNAVLLDLTPTGNETRDGLIMIASKDSVKIDDVECQFECTPLREVTVAQIIAILLDKGMSRYRFDDTGSGCRYWCDKVLDHLAGAHILAPGTSVAFEDIISEKAQHNSARFPPLRKGSFY